MKEGVGEAFTIQIIIIFIVISFAFIIGAINYYKAFKVNSAILLIVDKYEGYNDKSIKEIESTLNTMGYTKKSVECPASNKGAVNQKAENSPYAYCIYYYSDDTANNDKNSKGESLYYNYSVVSYISLDLPIIGNINIPVHTKGERIYRFGVDEQ